MLLYFALLIFLAIVSDCLEKKIEKTISGLKNGGLDRQSVVIRTFEGKNEDNIITMTMTNAFFHFHRVFHSGEVAAILDLMPKYNGKLE